jgi:hypothetical protein
MAGSSTSCQITSHSPKHYTESPILGCHEYSGRQGHCGSGRPQPPAYLGGGQYKGVPRVSGYRPAGRQAKSLSTFSSRAARGVSGGGVCLPSSLGGGQCKGARWVSDYRLAERQAKFLSIITCWAARGIGDGSVRRTRDHRRAGFLTLIRRAGPSPYGSCSVGLNITED